MLMPSTSGKKLKMLALLSIIGTRVVLTLEAAMPLITFTHRQIWVDRWWMSLLELQVDPDSHQDPGPEEEKSLVAIMMTQSLAAARARSHQETVYSCKMEERLDDSIRTTRSKPI
jgi:hypothetical protein